MVKLKEKEILAVSFGPQTVRFMTHKDVNESDAEYLISSAKRIMIS